MPNPFDEIIIGAVAKAWLKNRRLLPSDWGLSLAEESRIRSAGIRLTLISGPASTLKLSPNPLRNVAEAHLVVFDLNCYADESLSRNETIATFLHEIGHVINVPPVAPTSTPLPIEAYVAEIKGHNNSAQEFEADDYARYCGFGAHVATSLEKMKTRDPSRFHTELTRHRISRILDGIEPSLHFLREAE